jgi:hypothetical protein
MAAFRGLRTFTRRRLYVRFPPNRGVQGRDPQRVLYVDSGRPDPPIARPLLRKQTGPPRWRTSVALVGDKWRGPGADLDWDIVGAGMWEPAARGARSAAGRRPVKSAPEIAPPSARETADDNPRFDSNAALPGAQPLGCRAALTLLPCRRRRSWVDRPTVLWIRPMTQGAQSERFQLRRHRVSMDTIMAPRPIGRLASPSVT